MVRNSIRFSPDPLASATLDVGALSGKFSPTIPALIMNESQTGCGLIVLSIEGFHQDQQLRIQVGHIGPLAAKITWVKLLEPQLYKLGIQYLE